MSMGISAATWGMIGAGATVGGTLMNAGAAGDALDAQEAGAARADNTQRYIYDQNRADQMPFLRNGTAASNKLAQLLGLAPSAPDLLSTGSNGAPSYNAELYASNPLYRQAWDSLASIHSGAYGTGYTAGSDRNWIEQGIRSRLGADGLATLTPAQDSSFGSLLKPITQADIEADPVFAMSRQFGLDEGTKGINRQAAATGSMLSGATLKALTRYGNDYASTKGNDAQNRINAGRQQTYSMLSGVSGGGQAAAGQTQAAGTNYANAVGQTAVGLGNARGASMIAGANAINNGISQGIGMYQGNQLLQALQRGGGGGFNGPIAPWNGAITMQPTSF